MSTTNKQASSPVHGYMCDPSLPSPIMVVECKKEARPGYSEIPGHEYNEANDEVLMVSLD